VALDRQSIEKKDFPIGRRGYDPAAVDAHLSAIADAVDDLSRSDRGRSETLSAAASEHVRKILEAAEGSAGEIRRRAQEEAGQIRDEARSVAEAARKRETTDAKQHVSKLSKSAASMSQRIDAMQAELGALMEPLRTRANRLSAELKLLEGNLDEVSDAATPGAHSEPEPEAPVLPAEPPRAAEPPRPAREAVAAPEVVLAPTPLPEAEKPADEAGNGADDAEGARLIALNMALSGTPRDETDRYLAENYKLSDRQALLDEVYASVDA
jgi:DivIVA domain-containing protein